MREKYIFLIGFGFGIVFITFIAFFVYNLNIKSDKINSEQQKLNTLSKEYDIF